MNSQTQGTNGNAEPRYVCTNWDTSKNGFRVKVNSNGRGRKAARKVITQGISFRELGLDYEEVKSLLNMGLEVRLRFKGQADEAIRLFPLANTDNGIDVCAATMGAFRKETLAGKNVQLLMNGKAASVKQVKEYEQAQLAKVPSYRQSVESVTPDMMVECPKCGYTFRVGRRNSEK